MPVFHMETELVRSTGDQLQRVSASLQQQAQQLNYAVQSLTNAWQGYSANIFMAEIQPLLQQLNQFVDNGQILNQRLQREVDEWERVDNRRGSGMVLGVAASGEEVGNETTLTEWFEGVYETIEEVVSKIAPHAQVTEWLSAFGTALQAIDLVTSTREVVAASEAWKDAMNQYGVDAPETLALRYDYSDAELSQVIPGPFKLILKQLGLWDDLIHSFEGAKYEGTHNPFNPPPVQ